MPHIAQDAPFLGNEKVRAAKLRYAGAGLSWGRPITAQTRFVDTVTTVASRRSPAECFEIPLLVNSGPCASGPAESRRWVVLQATSSRRCGCIPPVASPL